MINVSFGHEKGCGAEAFLKSLLLLNDQQRKHFTLFVNKKVLSQYLDDYGIKATYNETSFTVLGMTVPYKNIESKVTPSTDSLLEAMNETGMNDVLLTLPTSKDQLYLNTKQLNGHTELFREFYKDRNLTMNFINSSENLMLVTDHIPLKEVVNISTKEIVEKVNTSLQFLSDIHKVCISGINPHAGENGLIGKEDNVVNAAIEELRSIHKNIEFLGPLPGDTLHYHTSPNILKVYMAHDQGLSYFKGKHGINGANVTFGLPFIRLSVDHGTAFDLYGKNVINYTGSLYTLRLSLKFEGKQ
jgi:4-hydroxythreonine-4-phosphate dehydrogenase